MELEETVSLMCSESYISRFKAEVYQLSIRLEELNNLISCAEAGYLLEYTDLEVAKIRAQRTAMEVYLDCLMARAEDEGIIF